jgi:nitroimidazol reductase NimA-like FMN-containing flavoprotein (pyridoxamine 5'-phosphate oxidase superfamily)
MQDFEKTKRTTLKRLHERGHFDRETVYAILDEALICHVGIIVDGAPVVIPTACWRDGDTLYLHGSSASHLIRTLKLGAEACVTVSLLDGLVMARSAFHHSFNYRSVVIFGRPEAVEDAAEKRRVLRLFVERVAPGRWEELRPATDQEIKGTGVVRLSLTEASAKIRTGPPIDDEEDYGDPVWAGVVPVSLVCGVAEPDSRLTPGIDEPPNIPKPGPLKGGA